MLTFSHIIGQRHAEECLQRAMGAAKVAHAYLFAGPEGVGKAAMARAFFCALNCDEAPNTGCGHCESCSRAATGVHPDLIVLEKDGAFIKIDQVRALEERLGFPPHQARWRVVLINDAHLLNANAANALLKSVEEPRPGTLFTLITSALHKMMPTLISRCQRVRFGPLTDAEVLEVLRQNNQDGDVDEASLTRASSVSEGSPARALQLLESDALEELRHTRDALFRAAQDNSAAGTFSAVQEAGKDRAILHQVLELMRVHLRDGLLLAAGIDRPLLDANLLAPSGVDALLRQIRAVQRADAALLSNANPSLTLETLVFELNRDLQS
ncbi:MAG: DNA polymerase III subunit delta' [Deltaproteobacteria bacterium]|nr:DNA polymerase III subunit delta' [Deltaproteobacteria bacterium]